MSSNDTNISTVSVIGAAHLVVVSRGATEFRHGAPRVNGRIDIDYGGAGYNIATSLAPMGFSVRLGTILADTAIGRTISHAMEAEKVAVWADYRSGLPEACQSAHVSEAGEPTSVIASNPAAMAPLRQDYIDELLHGTEILVLDASLHLETLIEAAISAGEQRVPVWLAGASVEDAAKALVIANAGARISALFVNSEEMRSLVDAIGDFATPQMLAHEMGGVVIETRGHRGVAVWSGKQSRQVGAWMPHQASTAPANRSVWLGAGDFFLAQTLYRHIALGEKLPAAACAAGEAVTTRDPSRNAATARGSAFERRVRELQAESDSAFLDSLTKIANRRGLERYCRTKGPDTAAAVLMVDIDHFKAINDHRGGHAVGDQVLSDLGGILADAVRAGDCACRLGGEEFVLIVTSGRDPLHAGTDAAERIRHTVENHPFICGQVTCSVGVSAGRLADFEHVLKNADRGVYQAKQTGRNKVVVIDPSDDDVKVAV